MTRDDIQKWQAKKIRDALSPAGNYLARLRERMEKRGLPPAGPDVPPPTSTGPWAKWKPRPGRRPAKRRVPAPCPTGRCCCSASSS